MSIKHAHFEWLLSDRSASEPPTANPTEGIPPLPGLGGQAHMEQASVFGDSDLYLFNCCCDEAVTLHATDERSGRLLGVILSQAGSYRFQPAGCDQPCSVDRDTLILHSPEERAARYFFPAHQRIDIVAFTVGRYTLQQLLAEDRPPAVLRGLLEERPDIPPLLGRMTPSPAFDGITRQMANNPYSGSARRLFFEAKVLECFAELLHRLAAGAVEPPAPALSPWERSRVFEARDVLVNRIADPPGVPELARLVNLPLKRFNRLFRDVFGTTPFAWVRDYRLMLARQLLTEENLSIKQVAYRLGYANVHNFTHAFTARFGVTPGAVRGRERRNESAFAQDVLLPRRSP